MRRTIWLTVILLIGLASRAWPSQLRADEQTDTRRPAIQPVSFRPLALGQIKPSGWLREQLKTQAAGLSGHLKVKDNPQFADWEVFPTTPWNYALEIDREHPEQSVTFDQRPMGSSPFTSEAAPVIARVKGRRLADWKIAKGTAAPPPSSPVKSTAPLEELTLIPYGCTDLRITEFPTLARR